jgi:hypothetical protein
MKSCLFIRRNGAAFLFHAHDKTSCTLLGLGLQAKVSGIQLALGEPKLLTDHLLEIRPVYKGVVLIVLPPSGS